MRVILLTLAAVCFLSACQKEVSLADPYDFENRLAHFNEVETDGFVLRSQRIFASLTERIIQKYP